MLAIIPTKQATPSGLDYCIILKACYFLWFTGRGTHIAIHTCTILLGKFLHTTLYQYTPGAKRIYIYGKLINHATCYHTVMRNVTTCPIKVSGDICTKERRDGTWRKTQSWSQTDRLCRPRAYREDISNLTFKSTAAQTFATMAIHQICLCHW